MKGCRWQPFLHALLCPGKGLTPGASARILYQLSIAMNVRSIPILAGAVAAVGVFAAVLMQPYVPTPAQLAPEETALLAEWSKVGDALAVQRMLDQGACVEAVAADGTTALMSAASAGHVEVVRLLLAHNAQVNAANNEGETALHVAVRDNQTAVVDILLEHGANVDAASATAVTPLMIAAWSGFEVLVERLLQAGADAEMVDEDNAKAATYARELRDEEMREKILKLLGA